MSQIRKELEKALAISQKRNEAPETYRKRILSAITKITDDKWESLSEAAQDWCNAAGKDVDKEKTPRDFPDAEASEVEESSDKKPARKGAAAKKAPAKKTAAKKEKEPKEPSARRLIKQFVISKPKAKVEEVMKYAEKEGLTMTDASIRSIRADTLDTLRVAADAGLLKFDA